MNKYLLAQLGRALISHVSNNRNQLLPVNRRPPHILEPVAQRMVHPSVYQVNAPMCPTGIGSVRGQFVRTEWWRGEIIGVYRTCVTNVWNNRRFYTEHFYAMRPGGWKRVKRARRL